MKRLIKAGEWLLYAKTAEVYLNLLAILAFIAGLGLIGIWLLHQCRMIGNTFGL